MPSLLVPIYFFPSNMSRKTKPEQLFPLYFSWVSFHSSLGFWQFFFNTLKFRGFFTLLSIGSHFPAVWFSPRWAVHSRHTSVIKDLTEHIQLTGTGRWVVCHRKSPVSFLGVLWCFWWCGYYREAPERERGGLLSKLEWAQLERTWRKKHHLGKEGGDPRGDTLLSCVSTTTISSICLLFCLSLF